MLKESVVPNPVALNAKRKAAFLSLALGVGLVFGLHACSPQTAIAIRTLDGAATSTSTIDGSSTANADVPPTPNADAPPSSIGDTPPAPIGDAPPTATTTSTTTSTSTADSGTTPGADASPFPLPFSDTFANGYANWVSEVVNGNADPVPTAMSDATNSWVTLDSTAASFSRIHSIPQFPYPNLSASMRFRIETAPTSTRAVRLDVRQSSDTPNVFYAVGATVGTDGSVTKVGLFKKVPDTSTTPGNYTICALPDPNAARINSISINQWLAIKVTISGTGPVYLSAYYVDDVVGDVLMASYVDDCSSPLQPTAAGSATVLNAGCLANQTGLGIQVDKGIKASFDDVTVTSP
jgi:hypothetical protein